MAKPAEQIPVPRGAKLSFNVAMMLTWARIGMIPLVVGVFYLPDAWLGIHSKNIVACALFVVAALTDAFDGWVARKYGLSTRLGAFLDPVADKLMVSAALIVLLSLDRVDAFVALIIVGREITISALREWMAHVGASASVAVNWIGKMKTILQMVAIGLLLFHDRLFGLINIHMLGTVLIYIAAALTVYSMFYYLKMAWPHLDEEA
jgi:CDP-diacylglycerol--glycerol-3-phosphate 3-phosphatidyltransferase